jgi:hypothetical protein
MIIQETLIDDPMQVAEHKDTKLPPEPPKPAIQGVPLGIVYPIGYSAQGAAEYIDALLGHSKTILIDTRIKPYSWNERWRKEELERVYGEKYHWAGRYLGNKALGTGNIEIADPEKGIAGLVKYLSEGYNLILLCQCKEFTKCHTSTIVDLLLQKASVEVVMFDAKSSLSLGSCVKCCKPGVVSSPSGAVYCRQCGRCQRRVYGAMQGVAVLREECNTSVDKFVMHPRLGIYVCPCLLRFDEEMQNINKRSAS